ncbi:ArsR/SmtB family transcription factor [Nonomuraea sp. NPDC048826]|uniref:ArsR/SmtB family transcription factor n=1 Tax=Nonomuraea sp. NPDC048826 TaxID=3364347 RepID=UPI0037231B69
MTTIEERVAALEARVAALEGTPAEPGGDGEETGKLVYGGHATFGDRRVTWEMARPPGWLVEQPPGPLAAVLAAAGHPARLRILQLLAQGPRAVADLQSELSSASQGQLYHHLKTLGSAGLVEQPERGVYRVTPPAIFPVLAMLAAATDVVRPR